MRSRTRAERTSARSGGSNARRYAAASRRWSGMLTYPRKTLSVGSDASSGHAAVAATPLEASDPTLKVFRGYVSIPLHLLEAAAYLLALLPPLRADVRSARVRDRIESLLPEGELSKWAVQFAVANTVLCAAEARTAGQAVLDRYTRRAEATLELPPGRKLHLRPAGLIVRVVQHH